ncbi:MAG: hypothetical protein GX794_04500, partial [Acholeplasmataceae bacterium]|nr:hypothetical protein [Acholeplasmataceae bacterium]
VNINTAINYGDIRAVKNDKYEDIIDYNTEDLFSSLVPSNIFYDYDDDFIIPSAPYQNKDIRLFPAHKRGIGGIVGRIQRARNHYLTTQTGTTSGVREEGNFDFIVNMNPNVDLIGRLDQVENFTSSGRYFIFANSTYFSAKENDTTQSVFAGFYYTEYRQARRTNNDSYFIPNVTVADFVRSGNNNTITQALAPVVYNTPFYFDTYHQVGTTNTLINRELSYSTTVATRSFSASNFTLTEAYGGVLILRWTTEGSVTNANRLFLGAADTPFITETPNSNSEEYVYHEDFVMRDENITLNNGEPITSYIYYAAKDLLADRFQATRPNGMYVLSTTAGSTFGSVLPRNFNVNKLSKILDNAANNLDYEKLAEAVLKTDEASFNDLLDVYKNDLYQTKLNDKSALLEENQYFSINDSNIGTLVNDGTADIDYDNNKVVVLLDRLILSDIRTLDFKIIAALLPDKALIARSKDGSESIEDFQIKLKEFRNDNPNAIVASGDLAADLSLTITTLNNQEYLVGSFISYSEAAVMDANFTNNESYYTEYELYIKIVQANQNNPPYLYQLSRDGNTFNNNFSNVTINNYLTLRFRDQYGILANGHVVDEFISLYYQDSEGLLHEVETSYYQIDSVKKTANQYFDTTITLDEKLRNGTYLIKYRIYATQNEQELTINHNLTRNHEIYDFRPTTSTYFDGSQADFAFGYEFDFEFIDNLPHEVSFATNTYSQTPY